MDSQKSLFGDADVASVAALIGDPSRASLLFALLDGRALAASELASEAGVAASTASDHLAKLVDGGMLRVERHGRHRYYRLAGPRIAAALEHLAEMAPRREVRSLRQGTRAHALRFARTCYDHLAGRLGVAIMAAMLDRGALAGHDGSFDPAAARRDRLSAAGHDIEYWLTADGEALLAELDIHPPGGRRPLVSYCVDWTEQRHHLRGRLGLALLDRSLELGWIRQQKPATRAVLVTEQGRRGLRDWLGLELPDC